MTDIRRTIDAVWRIESAKLIAVLTRMVRDVGLAEEFAQDALVAALEHWPQTGLPDEPAAWLMTVGKRRALDHLRRQKLIDRKHEELGRELEYEQQSMIDHDFDTALEQEIDERQTANIDDDLLRLVFIACHPVLTSEAQVALTLKLLGGLSTDEISRAFLVSEPTIAQRIVRAKRILKEAQAPFELPHKEELRARLASVLAVLYLIFNEGYAATKGEDWMRPALCDEALRLGRILAELMPQEPEVHGLVALMEIQASRFHARTNAAGVPILLMDQDRSRWDKLLIQRGLAALKRVDTLGQGYGPYALQAAIASCHARAYRAELTDWTRISVLYDALAALSPSPIVELNRAVAVSMAFGPAQGLALVDELLHEPTLAKYHLLPSVRGDFLFKLGRFSEAQREFERAATLTQNTRERDLLLTRAHSCMDQHPVTLYS
ncbi:RNA polymerase sigma factor [Aquirhabdus parva]|uniref:RNA polymerase sigma factor n=1 Tax=Aquirhabdus parva TaxID=2283318 RepID=A0A345P8M8_9GAMM|nr:RNA polymerase sigma factor [Aquirhabdus parva]AXI03637.1 RNA polymerase sigma factor [Aquirhabdus parva]